MSTATASQTETSAALVQHAELQRALAAELRQKARSIRAKCLAKIGRHAGQGNQLDAWRLAEQQGSEAEAMELERRADRCALRALRADEGRLLHSSEENQDVTYLREQGGYALLRMGIPTVTT